MTEKAVQPMITEPITLNNGLANETHNFVRTAYNGSSSDLLNADKNTLTWKVTGRIAHQAFGKKGESRRTLVSFTGTKRSVDGVTQEVATFNLTIAQPSMRSLLTDAEMKDLRAYLTNIVGDGEAWANLLRGEA